MKAFEETWDDFQCELDVVCRSVNGCDNCKVVAAYWWKACLEYLRSKADSYVDQYAPEQAKLVRAVPVSVIDEELSES